MFKIDFMGIGIPKAATTWLSKCLELHPDIDFAKSKEVNYFLTSSSDLAKDTLAHIKTSTLSEYKNQYKFNGNIKGEYNVVYLFDKGAALQIKKNLPNVKLIVLLRSPLGYLKSSYYFDKASKLSHLLPDTLDEAILGNNPYFQKYIKRAYYYEHLKYYIDIFGRDNIYINTLENIKEDPDKVLKEVYSFIGVDTSFIPDNLNKSVNKTKMIRNPFIARLINYIYGILMFLRLGKLVRALTRGNSPVITLYNKYMKKDFTPPIITNTLKQKVYNQYKEDILKSEKDFNIDLSNWHI